MVIEEPSRIVVGAVACGNDTEPILPGGDIFLSDLTPEAQALVKAALAHDDANVAVQEWQPPIFEAADIALFKAARAFALSIRRSRA